MDYAWVVPDVPGEESLTSLSPILSQRSNTGVVPNPSAGLPVDTLNDFVVGQQHFFAINPNVDDLIVVAHGSDSGILFLSLDTANQVRAFYEKLENVNKSKAIRWDASLGTANTSFRLESC